jgi:sugar lactone lactonase YvrE/enterochelin esterase-like enzyme
MIAARVAPCLLSASLLLAQTEYPPAADSVRQPGVPAGTVTQHRWTSTIFPGTERDYWVYVPAQYRPDTPAAVMVFQDGGRFVSDQDRWHVPVVFDNLIHKGEMPVTIGIFVNPGVLPAPAGDQAIRYNRSYEYDGLGDRYARFLMEEILPEVGRSYTLTSDPNLRAIGGSSSGASCAFTVAWNRPDAFRRVLSFIGSYTGLRGADVYPMLVRKAEPRPLRVFLQDGTGDLNLYSGNWWIGNQDLASALEYAGYDARFVTGDQGHNNIQGAAILPDALRWLFRDWTREVARSRGVATAERHFVTQILDPDQAWQVAYEGRGAITGAAVDRDGNVYVAEGDRIQRIEHASGRASVFRERTGGLGGLRFGPDGRLYAVQGARRRIVAYSADAREAVVARGVTAVDLVVGARGQVWFSESGGRIWHVDAAGRQRVVREGLDSPAGLALSPDQTLLDVADARSRWVWSFRTADDGSLLHGEPFYRLEAADGSPHPAVAGLAMDTEGYLYAATELGVQVCDQPGRVTAILDRPRAGAPGAIAFGGPALDTLYATSGDKVFRRRLRRQGAAPWQPVKPPVPRL